MKILHLMRHAKSAWDQPGLSDRERELNKRGMRDAPRMGEALAQRMAPMVITVSPARRAQLTLAGLCVGWPALAELPHRTEEDLYTFSADDLFNFIAAQDDGERRVFIIGHNPALTELINTLVGDDNLYNLPTAGYVELALAIDRWRDVQQACAMMPFSLFPKELSTD